VQDGVLLKILKRHGEIDPEKVLEERKPTLIGLPRRDSVFLTGSVHLMMGKISRKEDIKKRFDKLKYL